MSEAEPLDAGVFAGDSKQGIGEIGPAKRTAMNVMMERREDVEGRVPIQLPIELGVDDPAGGFEGDSLDVSTGGLALRADWVPEVGTQLSCRFAVQPGGARVHVRGKVVWAAPEVDGRGQFGLRFMNLAVEQRALIAEMLAEHVAHGHFARQVEQGFAEAFAQRPATRDRRRDTLQLDEEPSTHGLEAPATDPGFALELEAAFADVDDGLDDEITATNLSDIGELMVVPQGEQPMRLTAEVDAAFVEAEETYPDGFESQELYDAAIPDAEYDAAVSEVAPEPEPEPEPEFAPPTEPEPEPEFAPPTEPTPLPHPEADPTEGLQAASVSEAEVEAEAEDVGAEAEDPLATAPDGNELAPVPDSTAVLRFDPGLAEVEGLLTERRGERARFEQPLDMLALGQGLLLTAGDGQVSRARIAAVSLRMAQQVPQLSVELELLETDEALRIPPRPATAAAETQPEALVDLPRDLRFRSEPTVTEFSAPRLAQEDGAPESSLLMAATAAEVPDVASLETARAEDVQLVEPGPAEVEAEADASEADLEVVDPPAPTEGPAVEEAQSESSAGAGDADGSEANVDEGDADLAEPAADAQADGEDQEDGLQLSGADATPPAPALVELPEEPAAATEVAPSLAANEQVAMVKGRKALDAVTGAFDTAGRLGRTAYITARLMQQKMSSAAAESSTFQGLKQKVTQKKKRTVALPAHLQNPNDDRRRLLLMSYAAFGLMLMLTLLIYWLWPGGDDIELHRQVDADPIPAEAERDALSPAIERGAGRSYLESSASEAARQGVRKAALPITAKYGDPKVPNPMHFKLRMTGNIRRLRGSRDRGGFAVTVLGVHSFDPARPLAAAHPAIADSIILNRGNRAELTVRFVDGERPAFRVYATGPELHLEIEQK